MQVRSYEPTDREAVQALSHRLTEGVAPWRDPVKVGDAVAGWVRESLDRAETETCAVFVASEDDQAVGFVTVTEQRHWSGETDAYIGELVVAVHAEGRGVGRALAQAAEQWAVGRGHRQITLEMGAANHAARRFYASLGYARSRCNSRASAPQSDLPAARAPRRSMATGRIRAFLHAAQGQVR